MPGFLKKLNVKSVLLALSLILNALGGAGIVPPILGQVVGAASSQVK